MNKYSKIIIVAYILLETVSIVLFSIGEIGLRSFLLSTAVCALGIFAQILSTNKRNKLNDIKQ